MGDDLLYISEETWDNMHGAPEHYVRERETRKQAASQTAPPANPVPPTKHEPVLRLAELRS